MCVMIHMVLTAIALIVGKIVVTFLGVVMYRDALREFGALFLISIFLLFFPCVFVFFWYVQFCALQICCSFRRKQRGVESS